MPKKEKSDFVVFQEMSENNMDISCSVEQLDFQRNKRGGRVTFGVASPYFDHLINQAATGHVTHHAILYIINKEQFDKLKKTDNPIDEIKQKAAKWDALAEKIARFYEQEHDQPPIEDGDLGDIGEAAAMAFGYL